jgi:CRISPR-associated protein Cas2
MLVLITYDISTETESGRRRLRKVSKKCQDFGQRVQNSVFECVIDSSRFKLMQAALEKIIDPEVDSIRYYFLGDEWRGRVVHVGAKVSLDLEGTLIA